MKDQGDAEGLEAASGEVRPVEGGRRGEPRAEDVGEAAVDG